MKIKKNKNLISSKKPSSIQKNLVNDDVIKSVLNNLPIAVIVFNLNKILFINKAAIKIFKPNNKLLKSIQQFSIFDFLLPEYHQRIKENSIKILNGEEFVPYELKIKNAKNQIIDLEIKSNAIEFNGQKVVQTLFTEISDQVKYRDELTEAKENLELITSNANDLIYFYTYHPKPKYLYISPVVKKMLGFSPNDFYKNPHLGVSLVVHNKEYTRFEKEISKLQKNNQLKTTSKIFQYKTKSGKLIWLEDNYSPIFNENGKIKFILGISRDVTNEKNIQLELTQKWINYNNLIDKSPVGIFIHKGICLYSNQKAAEILEIKDPKKLIGKYLIDFIIPQQRHIAVNRLTKITNGKEDFKDLIYTIKTAKGNIIDVELRTVPFVFNGEKCVQTIISNITAEKQLTREIYRKQLAEEINQKLTKEISYRKKIETELVAQTKKYEAIFNNTNHLIWTLDKNFNITSFNKNYANYIKLIFNVKLKIGISIYEIAERNKKESNLKTWITKLNQVFKNKNNTPVFFEIVNTDINGNKYFREITIYPLRFENNRINEVAIIGHDVTEQKNTQNKILEQSSKLKAIFESGNQLIWTINRNFIFTSFNTNFSTSMIEMYNEAPTIETEYKPLKNTTNSNQHKWWIDKYNHVFNTGKSIEFTVEQINLKNVKSYRQIFMNPIFRNNKVEEVSCISNDITELKHLQNESINQAAKLSSIFESSSHLIWTVDKEYFLTSCNTNFNRAFNENYGLIPILNTQLHKLLPNKKQNEYTSFWYNLYDKVLKGNSLVIEHKQVALNGVESYKKIFLNPVRNQHNEIIEIACLANDITESKTYEEHILNQSAKLKAIFETGDQLIWTVNKRFELTSYNKNYINLIGINKIKKQLINNETVSVFDTISDKEKKHFWLNKYNFVLQRNHDVFIHKTIINEQEVYREIYLNPILLNNQVVEISVIAQNITDRIKNELKIIEQSAKLKAIFESGDQLMWTINKNLILTSFNQNYSNSVFDLYGYYPEVGKSMRTNKTVEYHSIWDEKYEQAFSGKQVEFISERTKLSGEKIIRQMILYPIKNTDGSVIEVTGMGFDITENKKNEEKIIQSLKEKEVLLKEVHHRVKNNMQVISSILNLQSSYVTDNYALNLIKECQNRIKSMAFIHESLYQTKNFEFVNFTEYITTLSKNLIHTYSVNNKKIKLILTLDDLMLNLDLSIPCGLIINEIISNSLKYAFPHNVDGIIFVTLCVVKEKVKIEIGDNGIGIPKNVDIKNTQTLGLQLVDTLVEQINGTLSLNRNKGTIFSIEFNQ